MSDWKEAVDPNTGRTYYYNKATRETSWKRPPGYGEDAPAQAPAAAPAPAPAPAASAAPSGQHRDEWVSSFDPKTNRVFYYNKRTRETRWDKPVELMSDDEEEDDTGGYQHNQRGSDDDDDDLGPNDEKTEYKGSHQVLTRLDDLRRALDDEEEDGKKVAEINTEEGEDGEIIRRKIVKADANHEFEFNQHKRGIMGPILSTEDLLSWQKEIIKTSIFKLNSNLASQATQTFRNITGYMGDRNSSKDPMPHALKLLKYGLYAPEELRDEIYLQICKQTNNNPNGLSNVKGWELMAFCLGTFPPSENFESFLFAYFEKNMASSEFQADSHVQQLAEYCKDRGQRILSMGPRREVPALSELECVKTRELVPVRVSLLNAAFKTFSVDSFTLMGDLVKRMYKKLELDFTLPFTIFEVADNGDERIPDPEERVLDVVASWERLGVENKKAKSSLKMATKFAFVFKAMLSLKTSEPQVASDEQAITLFYYQAVHDVITSRYPTVDKDITTLGALQLQSTYGDYHPDAHGPETLSQKLGEFIPSAVFDTLKKPEKKREFARKLIAKYAKLTGYSALDAKLNYLDYVQQWPIYGCTYFKCQTGGMQFRDYPNPLLVGINADGILLVHPETRVVLDRYTYSEIVTWGSSDEKFIVVVGNLVQQKKLFFKSDKGKEMNNLVQAYVKFKLGEYGAKRAEKLQK